MYHVRVPKGENKEGQNGLSMVIAKFEASKLTEGISLLSKISVVLVTHL